MRQIKIGIAEDNETMRSLIVKYIQSNSRLNIVCAASNGLELINNLDTTFPDIVILDINMPVLDGFDTLNFIRNNFPDIKVIMFSLNYDRHHIELVKKLGASSFVSKSQDLKLLIDTIIKVNENGITGNEHFFV